MRREGECLHRLLLWSSLVLLLNLALPALVYAKQVTLAWDDPNPEGSVDGYNVYYKTGSSGDRVLANYDGSGLTYQGAGFSSGSSVPKLDPAATSVTCTLDGLSDTETYYFVVTAYAGSLESDASNEASTADGSTASSGGGGGGCLIVTAADGVDFPRWILLLAAGMVVLVVVAVVKRRRHGA